MLAPHPLQVVADLAATSQWDRHRILAQVALVESLPLAAFLQFLWGHHRILTWALEAPMVQVAQCHQDILWGDQGDQWEALVDQWEALEDRWEALVDTWEAQADQWEALVDPWEAQADQWAALVDQWEAQADQWVALEDPWEALVDLWEALVDPWEAQADQWEAQADQWADQWDLVDSPQECQADRVALGAPCPCPPTRSTLQTSRRCSTRRTPTHLPFTPVASVTRKCTTMTRYNMSKLIYCHNFYHPTLPRI